MYFGVKKLQGSKHIEFNLGKYEEYKSKFLLKIRIIDYLKYRKALNPSAAP